MCRRGSTHTRTTSFSSAGESSWHSVRSPSSSMAGRISRMLSPPVLNFMTSHFVKRDLRDFLVWWVALAALTLLIGAASLFTDSTMIFLWMTYYMFGLVAGPQVLGSVWRTQHQWSRHYLLALPIAHRRLFAIQHVRMLMFWLPLIIATSVSPVVTGFGVRHFDAVDWALYYFGVLVTIGILIEQQIWMTLDMERIATYLPKSQRVWAWVRSMGLMWGMMVVLAVAWFDILFRSSGVRFDFAPFSFVRFVWWSGAAVVIFPAAFVITGFWARHNARRWCVTL